MSATRKFTFLTVSFILIATQVVFVSAYSEACEVDSADDTSLSLLQTGSRQTHALSDNQSRGDPKKTEKDAKKVEKARDVLPKHLYTLGLEVLRTEQLLDAVVANSHVEFQVLEQENVSFRIADGTGIDGVDGYGLNTLGELEVKGSRMLNMLDIGGHIGRVSIVAFKKAPKRMRLVAVEPMPITYFLLRWNLWLNGIPELTLEEFQKYPSKPGVVALNFGIVNQDGQVDGLCYTYPYTMMARDCECSITADGAWHPEGAVPDGTECFPMVGHEMDYFLDLFGRETIALLKMDCEGCEYDAIPQVEEHSKRTGQQIIRFAGELHEQGNDREDFACKFDSGRLFIHVCFKPEGWAGVPLHERCKIKSSKRPSCLRKDVWQTSFIEDGAQSTPFHKVGKRH